MVLSGWCSCEDERVRRLASLRVDAPLDERPEAPSSGGAFVVPCAVIGRDTMSGFDFDDSEFPLVRVRTPPVFDDGDFIALFRRFELNFARRERYALVLDASPVQHVPTAKQRALISAWEKDHVADTRRWNVGTALVVTSALVRGVLTALAWAVPDETPRVHVATVREAVEWCNLRLDSVGVKRRIAAAQGGAPR